MTRRIPMIAGNWKMHTNSAECEALCKAIREGVDGVKGVDKVVCPPFPYLGIAQSTLRGSSIHVGAQNMHWEDKGAFTGEVSPLMLKEVVDYVIIGHSERRQLFCETDETVNKKLKAAVKDRMHPIFCVGETLEERLDERTDEILTGQVRRGLDEVYLSHDFVVAYEPVWAIGTGIAAYGPQANEAIHLIRDTIADMFGHTLAEAVRILYGGSMTADNVTEFMEQPQIDGGLVGGASLKADSFGKMVVTAAKVSSSKQ